ncbi:hypothetical protein PR003_g12553 [Phytophthora rubi]|uniref:Uncharacterized protein n=1 Tax=Phytophthora rubi TaxID=129364 RepID=A0A6A3LR01_9STRA|nr:hypothetical protein PR002_g12166 [Phytophthora rubi]KAE9336344.1 hypothetical protein PR003_g12553 [Phytophthora rubi]
MTIFSSALSFIFMCRQMQANAYSSTATLLTKREDT